MAMEKDEGQAFPEREPAEERYICRCEEVTEQEIRNAIRSGARSVVEVKRWTRAGMGICQGRSCRRLVERILAEELHLRPEEVGISPFRQPVRPVSVQSMDGERTP